MYVQYGTHTGVMINNIKLLINNYQRLLFIDCAFAGTQ